MPCWVFLWVVAYCETQKQWVFSLMWNMSVNLIRISDNGRSFPALCCDGNSNGGHRAQVPAGCYRGRRCFGSWSCLHETSMSQQQEQDGPSFSNKSLLRVLQNFTSWKSLWESAWPMLKCINWTFGFTTLCFCQESFITVVILFRKYSQNGFQMYCLKEITLQKVHFILVKFYVCCTVGLYCWKWNFPIRVFHDETLHMKEMKPLLLSHVWEHMYTFMPTNGPAIKGPVCFNICDHMCPEPKVPFY